MDGSQPTPKERRVRWANLRPGGNTLFVAVFVALTCLCTWEVVPEVLRGELVETDNYMRLVRVQRLVETGRWYDSSIPRSNAPFGEILHWTRPLDVLILGGRAAFLPFVPERQALHLAGVFLPPFLLLLTCFAIGWAVVPLAGSRFRYYGMIALLAQPAVVAYGLPGRVDHHILMLLLFTLAVGLSIRWLLEPSGWFLPGATGAVLGIGLWTGPEFLLPVGLLVLAGGVSWVLLGEDFSLGSLWLSIGLVTLLAVGWVAEHPVGGLLAVESDRLSAPHVLAASLLGLYWAVVVIVERRRASTPGSPRMRQWRVGMAGLGAVIFLGVLSLVYPQLLAGPTADIDPRIWSIWLDQIVERQSWVPPGSLSDVGNLLVYLGGAAFCVPFLAWSLRRTSSGLPRRIWAYLLILMAVYLGLALRWVRHSPYPEVLIAIVTVTILSRGSERIFRSSRRGVTALARGGGAAVLIAGPLYLGLVFLLASGQTGAQMRAASREVEAQCPLYRMTSLLSAPDGLGDRPRTILAHLDYGPELLYRTPHQVLGTPYHRNAEGILAGYSTLAGTDPAQVESLVRARGVELILVCPAHESIYEGHTGSAGSAPSLHRLLVTGREPPWMERITLPDTLAGALRLFEVKADRSAGEASIR